MKSYDTKIEKTKIMAALQQTSYMRANNLYDWENIHIVIDYCLDVMSGRSQHMDIRLDCIISILARCYEIGWLEALEKALNEVANAEAVDRDKIVQISSTYKIIARKTHRKYLSDHNLDA